MLECTLFGIWLDSTLADNNKVFRGPNNLFVLCLL